MGMFNRASQSTAQVAAELGAARSVTLVKGNGPAVSRETVESTGGVNMTKRFDKAGISLSKRGLDGIRAEVIMLLDHSGSMSRDYQNGTVQTLVERALGFAAQVDTDGQMPVYAFDDKLHTPVNVKLDDYAGIVDAKIWRKSQMAGTQMAEPFKQIKKLAEKATSPIYLIVIGDGSPFDRAATRQAVIELANYPVFIKFLAIRPVDFLQELDDISDSDRLLDNVDAKFISDPAGISDLAFADAMTDEWDSWIRLAQQAQILS